MPQNPGSSPVMDYNNAGPSQNVQYGGAITGTQGPYMDSGFRPPTQNPGMPMPNPNIPNPGEIMPTPGMLKPGMAWSAFDGGGLLNGDYRKHVMPPNMKPGGGGILNMDQPGYQPPVQNPGMPTNKAPGTRIDGGVQGEVYNPQPKPKGAFQGLSKGTMPSMKKHVQAGSMGKARKAFEAGGGKWTKDVHKRLKRKYG